MIINAADLSEACPIEGMIDRKLTEHGVSYGLTEAGYDIRVAQDIRFSPSIVAVDGVLQDSGRFVLASAMEVFRMPSDLVGVVHDKSTWARCGLSVFNTVIEPSFNGGLTLELVYHGSKELHIPAGAGIAQVLFHKTSRYGFYNGKYQNQSVEPVSAIFAEDC